jgi:hypothetical protein
MTEIIKQDAETTALREELRGLLQKYKIDENFVVDKEDLPMVVGALSATDIEKAFIDDEGFLMIEYTGN